MYIDKARRQDKALGIDDFVAMKRIGGDLSNLVAGHTDIANVAQSRFGIDDVSVRKIPRCADRAAAVLTIPTVVQFGRWPSLRRMSRLQRKRIRPLAPDAATFPNRAVAHPESKEDTHGPSPVLRSSFFYVTEAALEVLSSSSFVDIAQVDRIIDHTHKLRGAHH